VCATTISFCRSSLVKVQKDIGWRVPCVQSTRQPIQSFSLDG